MIRPGDNPLSFKALVAGLATALALLATTQQSALAQEPDLSGEHSRFEVTGFDPRFHDDPDAWLGDFGPFQLPGAQAQAFSTGVVGLAWQPDPREMAKGVRLSGEAGEWTLDLLGVQARNTADLTLRDSFVARLHRALNQSIRLGFIFTGGDPESGADASTVGTDIAFSGPGALEGQAWLQRTEHPDVEGDDGDAWGVGIAWPGAVHRFDARFEHYGEDFDPALGWVSRPGVDDTRASYSFHHDDQRAGDWRLEHAVAVRDTRALASDEASGAVNLTLLRAGNDATGQWEAFASTHREVLVDGFQLVERLAIEPGTYEYQRYGMDYRSPSVNGWAVGLRLAGGDYLQGRRSDWGVSGEWRPADWLRLDAKYQVEAHRQPTGAFKARTLSFRSELNLVSGWSLAPNVQLNNINEQLGLGARLRWRRGPGSDFFLLWNRTVLRSLEDRLVEPLQDSVLRGIYKLRF